MATIGDTMVTLLTDNWAGAGAAPTIAHLVDYQKELADTTEQVIVRLPIHEDVTPINDTYSNFKYTIQIRVKSTVSDDRLKVLADEVIRIVNTYAITGITRQFAKRGENTSDRKRQVFSYDVWAILEEHMSTGGTSYSSPGAGDVAFPAAVTVAGTLGVTGNTTLTGDLIVNGNDVTIGKPAVIKTDGTGSNLALFSTTVWNDGAVLYLDDDSDGFRFYFNGVEKARINDAGGLQFDGTLTFGGADVISGPQLAALLMFGSANAAWVPCVFEGVSVAGKAVVNSTTIENVDDTDFDAYFRLPLPTVKGGLKLYVTGFRVGLFDADDGDYISEFRAYGLVFDTITTIESDTTDYKSAQQITYAMTDTDCSGYNTVACRVYVVATNAGDLNIMSVEAECFYAV